MAVWLVEGGKLCAPRVGEEVYVTVCAAVEGLELVACSDLHQFQVLLALIDNPVVIIFNCLYILVYFLFFLLLLVHILLWLVLWGIACRFDEIGHRFHSYYYNVEVKNKRK